MLQLFDDVVRELPEQEGPSWRISFDGGSPPPSVRHARGYEPFVRFVAEQGAKVADLLDTWCFIDFVRAERARFRVDGELRRSAVIFLGNSFIKFHPELRWHDHVSSGLFLANDTARTPGVAQSNRVTEAPSSGTLAIEQTVLAFVDADEVRLREFAPLVARFGRTRLKRPGLE